MGAIKVDAISHDCRATLLELVPRFQDRLVKDVISEGKGEKPLEKEDGKMPDEVVQINSAEVIPAMIYDKQVPMVIVEIANQLVP